MAWETIAQIYRAQGTAYGTTYWDIDTDTTELNDDFTKYVTVQFNGQTLYVTKSAVYDFESYGGAIILVVKNTSNSGYIRERLVHSQSQYNYTTLLTPNYTENGLKVYIKSLSPEHLPNVQIPVTSNTGGSSMATNISIFSDRITHVYTYQDYMALMELPKVTSNGGGATHIAKRTGQLKDLSSYTSDILIVSGGGGGGLLLPDHGWDGHEIEILTSGENRTLTAQRSNSTLTFKMFTSGTEIYSFTPAVDDLSKINLSFIADLDNEVAKPSLIYDVGSGSYSYNQETPTDQEMADIFSWLDGSLPYVHVYSGYKADNSPELYWSTYKDITIDSPSREGLSMWKAYIVAVHRQTITVPEGWTLLDTRINRSGWQYVSVYSKVVTQGENVRVSQESSNALSLMSFYTDQYNTVVYDAEYYGDSADPMNWVFPAADYPRIFAFSLGYTTEASVTTKSVSYSPSLNGWQEPNIFSSENNYRSMLFHMTGEESTNTTLTYNGFSATGQWAEDKANSSQIVAYKVIYQRP